ncbi:hypothetical protein DNTS_032305 [Danionella cerebrum]|uniref:Dishevelled-binding antagonist of beta-catenin 3 n=1 Tax=Danionella cerebrum TaxID=2873325 RepID=A0A553PRB3_9TELE|nr:hypothetical protein DNTS_032305 [Danionella translucida]
MFGVFSVERGRQKRRLELSLAGLMELELLKRRHRAMVTGALALHQPQLDPELPNDESETAAQERPGALWSLMRLLQHQVRELKVDGEKTSSETLTDSDGPGDVLVNHEMNWGAPPRSVSCFYPPLEGITEGIFEDNPWFWQPAENPEEEPTTENPKKTQHMENFIHGLIQRRSSPAHSHKPRVTPETCGVSRQSSLSQKQPSYVPESCSWDNEDNCDVMYPRMAHPKSLVFPSGSLDHCNSELEFQQNLAHSASSEELVNAQYIPAQPCRAQARATAYKPPQPSCSPERKTRSAIKKCRFTEDKTAPKKPSRKACRPEPESCLQNPRGASEQKYNSVERDAAWSVAQKARRSSNRKWRSNQELSQDEAETPLDQPARRCRKPRPLCAYAHPATHIHPPVESESSLSEAETPVSSSLSSDSDGLVWPQQLQPQPTPSQTMHSKAFVKIKASHALKKKILRFRSGSLKVMTTV